MSQNKPNPFLNPEQVEIGYWAAQEEYDTNKLTKLTINAEKIGLESVLTSDHLQPWFDTNGKSGFAWFWMGAIAAMTKNMAIGTGVTAPDRYHPALIAQLFATFDEMFPGRAMLGLGAGEAINSRPLGIIWPSSLERVNRLREAAEIIQLVWGSNGKRVSYGGQFFRLNRFKQYTAPKRRIPMYIAAAGKMTAEIAGEFADGLVVAGDPLKQGTKEIFSTAQQAAKKKRNSDAKLAWLVESHVSYDPDYDRALKHARTWASTAIEKNFDRSWLDPSRFEEEGRKVPDEKIAEKSGVTTDMNEYAKKIEELISFGYTKIQIHSSSPDEEEVLRKLAKILPSINVKR
jgi:coenzyme F420-dependent glucose-6-phosphate dehydrogenase